MGRLQYVAEQQAFMASGTGGDPLAVARTADRKDYQRWRNRCEQWARGTGYRVRAKSSAESWIFWAEAKAVAEVL